MNNQTVKQRRPFTLSNIVFYLGFLFSLLLITFSFFKIQGSGSVTYLVEKADVIEHYLMIISVSSLFGFLFILALKLETGIKNKIASLLVLTLPWIFIFELYLATEKYKPVENPRVSKASSIGIDFDTRNPFEIIEGMKKRGVYAFPNVTPYSLLSSDGLDSTQGRIFPLGTISNSLTVISNESGYFPIVHMDEHGFNNPKGLYVENEVDIALVGDSFIEGGSLETSQTIAGVFRGFGLKALNLGKDGNSPLSELAIIKEFAEPLKPKVVLWFYYINDLDRTQNGGDNLALEMTSPFLRKYLDNKFSQDLIYKQELVDKTLKNMFLLKEELKTAGEELNPSFNISSLIKLRDLRDKYFLPRSKSSYMEDISNFELIVTKANHLVSSWGGKLYIVYLPPHSKYFYNVQDLSKEILLSSNNLIKIPFIDLHESVFNDEPDPLSLFPFREFGHYTPEGYYKITNALFKRLKEDDAL